MYRVNDQTFKSFTKACKFAERTGAAEVIEVETGRCRWTRGTIDPKAERRYREQRAAYEAQQRANSGDVVG